MLKGTLFIGIGEWRRHGASPGVIAVSFVLALAMLGVPFTSGAGAKLLLETGVNGSGFDFSLLFGLSALGTLLLMARFLWLLLQREMVKPVSRRAASLAWLALAVTAITLPLMLLPIPLTGSGFALMALALLLALMIAFGRDRIPLRLPYIPPGDLLFLVGTARRFRSGRFGLQDLRPSFLASRTAAVARVSPRIVWTLIVMLICVAALVIVSLPGRVG